MGQSTKHKGWLNKKTVIIASLSLALLGIWYASRLPIVVYTLGKWQTSRLQSKVAGLTIYKIPAAFHRQEHALSCEIAALKMALNAQGVTVRESELINKLVFDPTPHSRNTWGDPNLGFVGNIDGKMGRDGYGVYAEPIAAVANQYRRSEVLAQPTLEALVEHLKAGRPIVVWGYFGRGNIIPWKTPAGKEIKGVNGEHARTLIGFVGSDSVPEGFMLLDPIYGELYWPTEKFMENWDALDRMAVVIYAEEQPPTPSFMQ